jgi:shikimate kinase
MGAGKTTVGKTLAQELNLPFYDLDWYIESRMRKTVKEIFDERGEEGFRLIEHNLLHEVAEFEDVIISCGGGVPCFYDNMDYMNQKGDTVYLKATPEVLYGHLKMGKSVRPLLQNKTSEEVEEFIKEQLQVREPFYSKAKYTLDVNLMDDYDKIRIFVTKLRELLDL